MAEPDFTDASLTNNLADVIKRDPSPTPSSSYQQQQPQPAPVKIEYLQDLYDEEDEDSSQDEEMPDEFKLPPGSTGDNQVRELIGPLRKNPYDESELKAGAVDGRCQPGWPLAHLWPVYVGNFRCSKKSGCRDAIRLYFASKGLLVHWFVQLNDDYFYHFQLKANLYDGLVYFGSEQDAQLALQCDHSLYNGYTLNVFPGREPVYFPPDRSAMFMDIRSGYVYSEEFFTRALVARHGPVRCVVKFNIKNAAAEFYSVAQKQKLFTEERQFKPTPVGYRVLQKQRYVEANIMELIQKTLQANPTALPILPTDPVFRDLQQGILPHALVCTGPSDIQPVRRGPSKRFQQTKLNNKLKKMRRQIERDLIEGKQPQPSRFLRKPDKQRWQKVLDEVMAQRNRW